MSNIKTIVRGSYDVQKLRIQMGNRIVANFKAKLGQEASMPESELGNDEKKVLDKLRLHYRKITDGIKNFPRQVNFKGDEVISSYTELCLLDMYIELEKQEAKHFNQLGNVLKEYPIYTEFLEKVKGCGVAMSGVIISEIDISKCKYSSSLWKYAGLDVAQDGQGRSKKKEHLVEVDYIDKDGKNATRVGITFNPFLKTKLVGVLASSFLRCGKDNPYSEAYYNYKNRLENHPSHKEKTLGHRHNMAMRYAVKRFLVDLYVAWRTIEGLPVESEYSEGKLGMKHGS